MRLLIIEDNQDLAANLCEYLEERGHILDAAADGLTGLHLAVTQPYDVIVLDLVLPGLDGLSLCRKLRAEAGLETPVLMLTARDAIEDRVIGLDAGADDYLIKPFSLRELEARLRALVRRAEGRGQRQRLEVADLVFDTASLRVTRAGREIELPPIPMRILEVLMRRSPRVVSRADLEAHIWGDSPPDSDALRTHLHVLRGLIDPAGSRPLLHTLRGRGYRLAADDALHP
jgi:DNA-binding response OmpR family regulator